MLDVEPRAPDKSDRYRTERFPTAEGLNWYTCDPSLQFLIDFYVAPADRDWVERRLTRWGELCGGEIARRADLTDKNPPRLERYDRWGHEISEVILPQTAIETKRDHALYGLSGQIAADPDRHPSQLSPVVQGAFSYLLCQAEIGMACAVGMTSGVASLVEKYAPDEIAAFALPHLRSSDFASGFSWDGAMLMTERAGGSDVGATETVATQLEGARYLLNGLKWFASNADGKAYVTLARPEGAEDGVKGVSLFLVLKTRLDGSANGVRLRRLKDKLGTRAVPSAEVEFVDAEAWLLSGGGGATDGKGMSRMMEMVTGSRVGVAVMGLGAARRALVESLLYTSARSAFGGRLIDKPLVREKLARMIVDLEAAQALTFEAHGGANRARASAPGDERRLLVPLAKLQASRLGVNHAVAAVEMLGGNGYIENWPVARNLRDSLVNLIWEGTDNIICLDVRRAIEREDADDPLLRRLKEAVATVETAAAERVRRSIEDLRETLRALKLLERDLAESRLQALSEYMADVAAAALLVEQAEWELTEQGRERKALIAELFIDDHLRDPRLDRILSPDRRALDALPALIEGCLTLPQGALL
jgi:alkylation response protein AidB-like acyl-CoA dehydrogenase